MAQSIASNGPADDNIPAEVTLQGEKVWLEAFTNDDQLPAIMTLIGADLSEPYTIYTYRYFIHHYPQGCLLYKTSSNIVGVIICSLEIDRGRGYIGMLAIHPDYRQRGLGSNLIKRVCLVMKSLGLSQVVLEAELSNKAAISLYERIGFIRDKRLVRYYMHGQDAYRLKLWL